MMYALLLLSALAAAEPERRTLASGLQVALEPVTDDGHIQLELRILAGAAEDPPGRSGLAHLAEHVALLPAADAPDTLPIPETEIEGVTTHDATRFLVRIAPESLEPALVWVAAVLSPRLAPLERAFEVERTRVAAEALRARDDEPVLRGLSLYPPGHPYHLPAAGAAEVIRALPLEDALDFVRSWYRPDGAVLALAGELPEGAAATVERLLGGLVAPTTPLPVPRAAPARAAAWSTRWQATSEAPVLLALSRVPREVSATGLERLAVLLEGRLRAPPWRFEVGVIHRRLGRELILRAPLPEVRGLLRLGRAGGLLARTRQAERRIAAACSGLGRLSSEEIAAAETQRLARQGRSPVAVAERLAAGLAGVAGSAEEGSATIARCADATTRATLVLAPAPLSGRDAVRVP